jgi:hypothetical protein
MRISISPLWPFLLIGLFCPGKALSDWGPLGSGVSDGQGYIPTVYATTVYDGNLIAGGRFTQAGGVSTSNIARWDGTSWTPLGSGMNGWVEAFTVYDGHLIAGGHFTQAGGNPANYVARWDGLRHRRLGRYILESAGIWDQWAGLRSDGLRR